MLGLVTEPTPLATALRADAARNRATLLRTAREQLDAGDSSLRMHAIARDAGVGVGTMYRHFPTREALRDALSLERLEQLVALAQDAADTMEPAPALHRVLCAAITAGHDPAVDEILSGGHGASEGSRALLRQLQDANDKLLAGARANGDIRADVSADDIRRLACGIQHALHSGGYAVELTALYSEILLAGLRPPAV